MSLVLLAISLSIALGVLAFRFAVFALPVMAGLSRVPARVLEAVVSGFGLSFLAGLAGGGALCSRSLIAISRLSPETLFSASEALVLFAVPAAVAGFSAGSWRSRNIALDPGVMLTLICSMVCGHGSLAFAAMINLIGFGGGASRPVELGCQLEPRHVFAVEF